MNLPVDQLIKIDDKNVFLVLTEQTGQDLTFYLRNDKANLVHRILQEEKSGVTHDEAKGGEAADGAETNAPVEPSPPEQKIRYSRRINILRPHLDKKDLEKDKGQFTLLSELRKAARKPTSSTPYAILISYLSTDWKDLLDNDPNEKLLPTLLAELNSLLKGDKLKELLNTTSVLPKAEMSLIRQPELRPNKVFTNYIKFCFLFKDAIKPLEFRVRSGRVLASLSYKGNIWSFTFREQESGTGYNPATSEVRNLSEEDADGNLNSIEALCQTLYEEIFHAVSQSNATESKGGKQGYKAKIDRHRKILLPEMHGLLVIAGSTNSAKSLITRGLIQLYLKNVLKDKNRKRRPHLVTFEEPIEKYFAAETYIPRNAHAQQDVAMDALKKGVDYTPRQKKDDALSLQQALRDALRQTPKVFFVGETRKKKDWQELIDFAGTGHLVITTAHAGSLLDAMHKIFLATEAKTPTDRSEVASRLLAIVHLKRTEVTGYQYGVLVPALWRRVPRGVNALTAEGLASVLPHSDSDGNNPSSCLGRKYFVERLLELAEARNPLDEFKKRLRLKAIDWDLQGA